MEIKREGSIKKFFLKFLIKSVIYILIAGAILFPLFILGIKSNCVIPANYTEQLVKSWKDNIIECNSISFDDYPTEAGYVLFEDGEINERNNVTNKEVEIAVEMVGSSEEQRYIGWSNTKYEKIEINDEICIVVYKINASFRNKTLANICPNVEVLLLILFLAFIIISIILVILQSSKKMEKEISKLQDAALEINNQNLDFSVQWTSIKEFNRVLTALDELKNNLSSSLKNQWQMEQDKRTQMSALAHDIKTPLTVIMGNSELLIEETKEDNEKQYSKSIYKNAKQIQEYVNKIIELSKDNCIIYKQEEIVANKFFNEVVQEAVSLGKLKNITINKIIEDIPESFLGFEDGLRRVFSNVFSNAIRFTPEGEGVTLLVKMKTVDEKNFLVCDIEDGGKGFSDRALIHAKEQFFLEDQSRTDRNHFGMGLYISNQIMESCNGSIKLENGKKGGKVTISISLNDYKNI